MVPEHGGLAGVRGGQGDQEAPKLSGVNRPAEADVEVAFGKAAPSCGGVGGRDEQAVAQARQAPQLPREF